MFSIHLTLIHHTKNKENLNSTRTLKWPWATVNMLKPEKVEDLSKEIDIKKNQISTKFMITKLKTQWLGVIVQRGQRKELANLKI